MTTTLATDQQNDLIQTTACSEPDRDLIERAAALKEIIRTHIADGDANGRLSQNVVDALEASGLLKMTVPKRYGGLEVNQRTLVDVLVELARADGAAGWSTMLISIGNWFTTTFSDKAREEIWAQNPHSKVCVVLNPMTTAERTDGGFMVSGRWAFASGSYIATHAMMGFLAPQPDGTIRHALGIFNPGEWSIEKSWNPIGLKGTGSDTVVIDQAFVPDHRIQYFADMVAGDYAAQVPGAETRTRAPFLPTGTIIFGAIQIGLAKAALDLALERLRSKGVTGTIYTEARNSPVHQLAVADAVAKIDAAEALAHRSSRAIDESATSGDYLNEVERARVRNDTGVIVTLVSDVLDQLLKAAGTGSFLSGSLLSRIYQDAGIAGSHAHATPQVGKEVFGRLLLGADGGATVEV